MLTEERRRVDAVVVDRSFCSVQGEGEGVMDEGRGREAVVGGGGVEIREREDGGIEIAWAQLATCSECKRKGSLLVYM